MKTDLNVLLVDDNEQLRELLTLLLSREHAHVTAVNDGQQAIDRLSHARYPFDLVISDVEMPHVDGWGLLAWVKEHDAALPVVLLSAGQPDSFIQTARAAGAFGAIPKPFQQRSLTNLLRYLLDFSGSCHWQNFYSPLASAAAA